MFNQKLKIEQKIWVKLIQKIKILKRVNLFISNEKIEILFEVGRGCFVCINKGILRNSPDQNITVAIKTVNKVCLNELINAFYHIYVLSCKKHV